MHTKIKYACKRSSSREIRNKATVCPESCCSSRLAMIHHNNLKLLDVPSLSFSLLIFKLVAQLQLQSAVLQCLQEAKLSPSVVRSILHEAKRLVDVLEPATAYRFLSQLSQQVYLQCQFLNLYLFGMNLILIFSPTFHTPP